MRLSGIRHLRTLAVGIAAAVLTACSSSGSDGGESGGIMTDSPRSSVQIADSWVRATVDTDDPSMTAAFGVLTNPGTDDRTIVSAVNSVSDRTELHEMAMEDGAMVMREVAGGITVPAGGSTTLEPGGLHVMIMDLDKDIAPGDEVTVTLTMDDGSTLEFTALAKEFAGGNEEYSGDDGSDSPMPMSSMSGHSG